MHGAPCALARGRTTAPPRSRARTGTQHATAAACTPAAAAALPPAAPPAVVPSYLVAAALCPPRPLYATCARLFPRARSTRRPVSTPGAVSQPTWSPPGEPRFRCWSSRPPEGAGPRQHQRCSALAKCSPDLCTAKFSSRGFLNSSLPGKTSRTRALPLESDRPRRRPYAELEALRHGRYRWLGPRWLPPRGQLTGAR